MITPENSDPDRDPSEMVDASEDVSSGDTPPEVVPGVEELTEWYTPLGAAGVSAPVGVGTDDFQAEALVQDGIEEADREQRIAAADPDLIE
jgi:hypothetical protein